MPGKEDGFPDVPVPQVLARLGILVGGAGELVHREGIVGSGSKPRTDEIPIKLEEFTVGNAPRAIVKLEDLIDLLTQCIFLRRIHVPRSDLDRVEYVGGLAVEYQET